MRLKLRLYLKQFNFMFPLLAFISLFYFTFISPWNFPRWVLIIGLVLLGIYTAFKTYVSLSFVKQAEQDPGKCFFNTAISDKPKYPLRNSAEEYVVLAQIFNEVTSFCSNQNSHLIELERNPEFKLPNSDAFFINALEGLSNDEYQLNGLRVPLNTLWKVHDRDSALAAMGTLWRSASEQEERKVQAMKNYRAYDRCLADFGYIANEEDKEVNSGGYDIIRFIWMTRACFTLGYIKEKEARDSILIAAVYLAGNYTSWEKLAYSYLIAFIDWAWRGKLDVLPYSLIKQRVHAIQQLFNDSQSPLKDKPLAALQDYIIEQGEKADKKAKR